jgi:putative transposase
MEKGGNRGSATSFFKMAAEAELLSLNRSSFYYKPVAPLAEEIAIKYEIDHIYTDNLYMGSRPITEILKRQGFSISRPIVQKYIREMGMAAIRSG